MKKIIYNYILHSMGFENLKDLLGPFAPLFHKILYLSVSVGSFVGFIETYTGISFLLWLFFCAASIFDLFLGMYANVFYMKQQLDMEKLFRGVFKAFVLIVIIFLTNIFKAGIEASNISPEYMLHASIYVSASLHYSAVLFMGLYILLGIAQNGAKIKIPFCVALVKLLNIKINKIEKLNEREL